MFTSLFGWFSQNSIIEGVGNELLLVSSFLGLFLFLVLAWMSTNVSWEFLPVRITVVRDANGEINQTASQGDVEIEGDEASGNDEAVTVTDENSESASDSDPEETEDAQRCGTNRETAEDEVPIRVTSKNVHLMSLEKQEEYAARFRSKGHLVLRLQYLNERTRFVHASPNTSIVRFKRKYFTEELNVQKNVRLIFQGRELTEYGVDTGSDEPSSTQASKPNVKRLSDYNVTDGSTVHCLVTTQSSPTSTSNTTDTHSSDRANTRRHRTGPSDSILTDFDMGTRLMEPLFAFLLAFTWFFRIAYRQYFNSVSTFALVALSVFFVGSVFAVNFVNAFTALGRFTSWSLGGRRQRVVTVTMIARRVGLNPPAEQEEMRPGDSSTVITTEVEVQPNEESEARTVSPNSEQH
ncbi:Transmembrane and ubiquitin domain-containing protein 2 [Fasciola gigantica]|uniref:Transmembrane and ubiquitin domain-containing protein 2 n=1 Tax=Fasciola gigantica TaxID=46835 RepID=A0A504Z7D7_FASGI|nr:Transmembrane and ubiquitin domain-containing protein 2 [Fasciola gigantica]